MRKSQSQPSLATLTDSEREQLAAWLRCEKYEAVRERVNKPRPEGFGLDISIKPLQTFFAKVALLDLINSRLPKDKKLTLAIFESLAARHITLLTSADTSKIADTHDAILGAVHDLATSGDNTPTQLLALQRLADFPARAAIREQSTELREAREQRAQEMHAHKIKMDQHHMQLAERSIKVREETLALRREESARRAQIQNSKQTTRNSSLAPECDELGPIPTGPYDFEAIRARARKAFNITPEESARRAALRHARMNPNPAPTDGRDAFHSVPNLQPNAAPTADDKHPSTLDLTNLLNAPALPESLSHAQPFQTSQTKT